MSISAANIKKQVRPTAPVLHHSSRLAHVRQRRRYKERQLLPYSFNHSLFLIPNHLLCSPLFCSSSTFPHRRRILPSTYSGDIIRFSFFRYYHYFKKTKLWNGSTNGQTTFLVPTSTPVTSITPLAIPVETYRKATVKTAKSWGFDFANKTLTTPLGPLRFLLSISSVG